MIEVLPGNPYEWIRGKESISPIGDDPVSRLAVANLGGTDAKVELEIGTEPIYPQSWAIVVCGLSVAAIYLLYFLQQWLFPKMSAIALAAMLVIDSATAILPEAGPFTSASGVRSPMAMASPATLS